MKKIDIDDLKFQKKLVKKLRSGKDSYEDADVEQVFAMLHNVTTDLGKRKELESRFKKAKKYNWN